MEGLERERAFHTLALQETRDILDMRERALRFVEVLLGCGWFPQERLA